MSTRDHVTGLPVYRNRTVSCKEVNSQLFEARGNRFRHQKPNTHKMQSVLITRQWEPKKGLGVRLRPPLLSSSPYSQGACRFLSSFGSSSFVLHSLPSLKYTKSLNKTVGGSESNRGRDRIASIRLFRRNPNASVPDCLQFKGRVYLTKVEAPTVYSLRLRQSVTRRIAS